MSEILIEYGMLRERINKLFELHAGLCDIFEKTAGDAERLDIFWDGDANFAYVSRIEKDLLAAEKVLLSVGNTIRLAARAFEIYNENEKRVKQMIGGVRK